MSQPKQQEILSATTIKSIDKRSISHSFGSSAATYDRGAALQRSVGNHLLSLLPAHSATLLDLGTGPGYFSSALRDRCDSLVALDIAPQMLAFAATRNATLPVAWIAGDAEALPLASTSLDSIYSSLMLQWVHDLTKALKEAYRVLKPGGRICFSTLLDGTLYELANAWREVDNNEHVNRFLSKEQLNDAIRQSGFTVASLEVNSHQLHYDNVIGLMRDLKSIGANQTANKSRGLLGRSALSKLAHGYEPYRTEEGLSATYQVAYCILTKDLNHD